MKTFGAICLTLLLLAVIGSAIGVVWTRHESRVLFVELSRLQTPVSYTHLTLPTKLL